MYKVYKIYKGKKFIKRIAMQTCPRLDYSFALCLQSKNNSLNSIMSI
jgi:hypothetical protein